MIPKEITSLDAPKAIGPNSQVLKVGDFVFVSGQYPLDENNQLVEGSMTEQSIQLIRNILALLSEMDLELRHIVKTTVYLKNLSLLDDFDQIYATYFSQPYPARTVVEVSNLPGNAEVAIDCFALDTLSYEAQFPRNNWDDVPEHDCAHCPDGTCEECM